MKLVKLRWIDASLHENVWHDTKEVKTSYEMHEVTSVGFLVYITATYYRICMSDGDTQVNGVFDIPVGCVLSCIDLSG